MTYLDILQELEEVNLKEKFSSEFETKINESLFLKIKSSGKIKSPVSLIRLLMRSYKNESNEWLFWQKVMVYFMNPVFARNKNNLPNN